jgi:hypothetical protein
MRADFLCSWLSGGVLFMDVSAMLALHTLPNRLFMDVDSAYSRRLVKDVSLIVLVR